MAVVSVEGIQTNVARVVEMASVLIELMTHLTRGRSRDPGLQELEHARQQAVLPTEQDQLLAILHLNHATRAFVLIIAVSARFVLISLVDLR